MLEQEPVEGRLDAEFDVSVGIHGPARDAAHLVVAAGHFGIAPVDLDLVLTMGRKDECAFEWDGVVGRVDHVLVQGVDDFRERVGW